MTNEPQENHPDIAEREKSAIYACTTIKFSDSKLQELYQQIMTDIVSGKRKTEFGYNEGDYILKDDITTQEKIRILQIINEIFKTKNIQYESCYLDMCGSNGVNCGLYFSDNSQLSTIELEFKKDIKFGFILDRQSNGFYIERETGQVRRVTHDKKEPHLRCGQLTI